ncbi:hypothetical protein T4C_3449 [Trichinella pseudospiralis]|uniref:Uncharacterized protein n=1 Tax=Trichinella pseudospiralis TaxID=6337 RepID=A0A0V1IDH5_TRIPS|nr:hypothetical protein T4C_3449 [Trichinella pseudospiralis]
MIHTIRAQPKVCAHAHAPSQSKNTHTIASSPVGPYSNHERRYGCSGVRERQDQSTNRSAQDTCRGLDFCRPCQPVTASEQLNDSTKVPTASWSIVVSNQHHVTKTGLLV